MRKKIGYILLVTLGFTAESKAQDIPEQGSIQAPLTGDPFVLQPEFAPRCNDDTEDEVGATLLWWRTPSIKKDVQNASALAADEAVYWMTDARDRFGKACDEAGGKVLTGEMELSTSSTPDGEYFYASVAQDVRCCVPRPSIEKVRPFLDEVA